MGGKVKKTQQSDKRSTNYSKAIYMLSLLHPENVIVFTSSQFVVLNVNTKGSFTFKIQNTLKMIDMPFNTGSNEVMT